MLIAAFDTSSTSGSIALVRDSVLVAELDVEDVGTHADWLMGAYSSLLSSTGIKNAEIDLFAVSIGPGSFTGLRIGVSTIKGLAWSDGKPVAGVSTLEAMALNVKQMDRLVCPMLDARKGEVYAALYSFTEQGTSVVIRDQAFAPDELVRLVGEAAPSGEVVLLGDGARLCKDALLEKLPAATIAPATLWSVRAVNVALIASGNPDAAVEPQLLSPVYRRAPEAEQKASERARESGSGAP